MTPSSQLIKLCLALLSTSIDDFTVMLVFLPKAHRDCEDVRLGNIKVMLGSMIGFSLVVFASLIAMLLGLVIPVEYIDLVGIVPLILGLYKLWELCSNRTTYDATCGMVYDKLAQTDDGVDSYNDDSGRSPDKNRQYGSYTSFRSLVVVQKNHSSIASSVGSHDDFEAADAEEIVMGDSGEEILDDETCCGVPVDCCDIGSNPSVLAIRRMAQNCFDPLVLEVAIFYMMCGSDNIAVYVSLFVSMTAWEVLFTTAMLYALVFSTVCVSAVLIQSPSVLAFFDTYSKILVPTILVPLGLFILSDSVAWPLKR